MGKQNGHLVRAAREHVFALFRGAASQGVLEYHHFGRTREIVDACKEIAKGSDVDDQPRQVALLCAWFYDACYATGSDDHARSLEACVHFSEQHQVRQPSREQIAACFGGLDGAALPEPADGAPVADVTPSDVLHDGRLAVLAATDYVERIELLRFELQRRSGKTFSDVDWTQHCIAFFGAHPYRTRFAQLHWGPGRAANLARLQRQLRKQLRGLERERADGESDIAKRIGKSAETLYYQVTRIQLGLIGLADHRTSTMIHVNAIMMSVVVALLARRIHTNQDLLVPTAFLLLVNLAVVFLSVNSMRTARAKVSVEEAHARDSNLMSFFNEKHLSLAEYTDGMSDLVADAPRFQRSVIEHLYFSRKVIQERGNTLRLTYHVFIYGITLAVAGFVIVLARR
jgi:hypothetical protein